MVAAPPAARRDAGHPPRATVVPMVLAALGVVIYLVTAPSSADLMAQLYRADLARDGTWLWSPAWFSGHLLPSYSVLSPVLGALVGVRVLGAIAVIAATAAFARLVADLRPAAGRLPASWFALVAVAALWTGRITFLLGVAIGLTALLAWTRQRPARAVVAAGLTALASPVAGLFLALAGVAWGLGDRSRLRTGLGIAACALGPVVLLNLAVGEGGTFPFAPGAFWPALAATGLVAALLPREARALRAGAGLYLLLLVAAFVLPTAVGGNATRLGSLVAGPMLAAVLVGRRPVALCLAAVPLLWWALYPPVADWVRARDDRALTAAYFAPLIDEITRASPRDGTPRVEIVPTANKGEAYYVARELPIARGWERQLDRKLGALFYADLEPARQTPAGPTIDAAAYRRWLQARSVQWVALPLRTQIDPASESEARLLRRPPPWLRPVWRSPDWVLFGVVGAEPAPTPARVTVTPERVVITGTRADTSVRVPIRHHRWWTVTAGRACVNATSDGFLAVRPRKPERIELRPRLTGTTCQ